MASRDMMPVYFGSLLALGPLQDLRVFLSTCGMSGGSRDSEPPPLPWNGGLSLSLKLWDQKSPSLQGYSLCTPSQKRNFHLQQESFFILFMLSLPDAHSIWGHFDVTLLSLRRFPFALPCHCFISPLPYSSLH